MKKNPFRMMLKLSWVLFAALTVFATSCKDDDPVDPPVVIEDGLYVKGAGTALTDYKTEGLLQVTRNEVTQENRASLVELFVAVKAGAEGFNIVEVTGGKPKTYGPGADFKVVAEADRDVDEPKVDFWRGSYAESTTPFTVPADGLYHIVLDKELKKIVVAPVVWGVIGGASPGGWGTSTPMPAAFNLNKMEFAVEDLVMLKNEWKFRYNDGWKIILDKDFDLGGGKKGIKVNTNLGGAVNALVPGGANIVNEVYAKYKVTLTWELGKAWVATYTKTGEAPPLAEYPAEMFMIGDGVGTWDWSVTNLPMVPVHSHPEYFWKIVWMNGTGGFKFCEKKEWGLDFGAADGSTGIGTFDKGTSNITVPATAGYYMVVVDLKNKKIEVTEPSVFMIGDCVGSWNASTPENKFTVDNANEKITFTKAMNAGEVRMHVSSPLLICDWWQAEFIVLNNLIEYRGIGGDQTRVPLTAGSHTIDLNFKTGAGSIN